MAVPRKGSRRIVVDGVAYRWRLRRRPTYNQAMCWTPCTYAVEHAENPGTTLVVRTPGPHPSNWLDKPAVPLRPQDVAHAIRLALDRGWRPTSAGPYEVLDVADAGRRTDGGR